MGAWLSQIKTSNLHINYSYHLVNVVKWTLHNAGKLIPNGSEEDREEFARRLNEYTEQEERRGGMEGSRNSEQSCTKGGKRKVR